MKVALTVVLLLAITQFIATEQGAGGANGGVPCCLVNNDPNQPCCVMGDACPCWNYRRKLSTLPTTISSIKYNKILPCIFDCTMLRTITPDAPMFESCVDPIVKYPGALFKKDNKLEFECFKPSHWNSYTSSSGTLLKLINTCIAPNHGCITKNNATFNNVNKPKFANLALQTTQKYHYWLAQYSNMKLVYGYMRCSSSLIANILGLILPCPSTFPEYFEQPNRISAMKLQTDSDETCPASSSAAYCAAFQGESFPNSTLDDSATAARRRLLALGISLGLSNVRCDCIPPDVNIRDVCTTSLIDLQL